jgi:4-amino-4-deoxy-L-arabinose transferase-like glycosyltransferase
MDQILEHPDRSGIDSEVARGGDRFPAGLILVLLAAAVFFACIISPPSLMDDVDAVQAQIARNMLDSGDWVIARLDGVPYLEKSPMIYWLIALSYRIFGVHDWTARIPVALAGVLLVWTTWRYALWAFGRRIGFNAGIVIATCMGLFLFTRIQIPDVMLTLCICMCFWSFQRSIEEDEQHPRRWSIALAASLGIGLLLKGLIAVLIPAGGIFVYLLLTKQLFSRRVWQRLHVLSGAAMVLAIAAPWHMLATLRMPPFFDFSMHSGPGEYHGFFWFYFINEHVLRFLNLRYPRDYNTVPRLAFWGLHLLWLFPWSVYFPAAFRLRYKGEDRGSRTRMLALCWTGFVLIFFTFSTTQEYYSMPVYPALAMILGCAMATDSVWARAAPRVLGAIGLVCVICIASVLFLVRNVAAPGDISRALQQHPDAYTLSLGHMGDLTLQSFAYLRLPLILAGMAFLGLMLACFLLHGRLGFLVIALSMVLFYQASRIALVVFDPYLSSRPLASALLHGPQGQLIINGEYYQFSSVFFYAHTAALLWNGRRNNLEYGSYALGSPPVFVDDRQFTSLWNSGSRCYVLSDGNGISHLLETVDHSRLFLVAESGGKTLYSNLARSSP